MEPSEGTPTAQATGIDQTVTVLVGSDETGGRFALIEVRERRGAGPPRHLHHWEDEALYVLAGALRVWVGGAWVDAESGRAVFLPRGVEHAFLVATDEARFLTVLTPAGFERFYADMDADDGLPPLERFVTAAARYGCEVTGPPLTGVEGLPGE
jgi:quercetin dioxygenase-like cupin family protein